MSSKPAETCDLACAWLPGWTSLRSLDWNGGWEKDTRRKEKKELENKSEFYKEKKEDSVGMKRHTRRKDL